MSLICLTLCGTHTLQFAQFLHTHTSFLSSVSHSQHAVTSVTPYFWSSFIFSLGELGFGFKGSRLFYSSFCNTQLKSSLQILQLLVSISHAKGIVQYFWSGSVRGTYSESVTFCRWRSVVSLLGEVGRNRCTWSQPCPVADGLSRKTVFNHIFKCLPKKINICSIIH